MWNKSDLNALLSDGKKPEWWKGNNRICYRFLSKIFQAGSELGGNQEESVKAGLLMLDKNLSIPTYSKNLKRKG